VHTQSATERPLGNESWALRRHRVRGHDDPAEDVAAVAQSKREILLRAYRHWLRREDLEDCYSQATLELIARARRGGHFSGQAHISNSLEQKFLSRIHDRRRALSGRSAMEAALDGALQLGEPSTGGVDVADLTAGTEERVAGRLELRRVRKAAEQLTDDQRLVLACQVALDMSCREFCERFGWSPEKYRKVAQRGRSRLRLLTRYERVPMVALTSEGNTRTHL
jgi:DNA-directed RNA polymerase specialized sigma24 family protein